MVYLSIKLINSEVKSLSRVQLFVTPWTAASQAPPSVGFSRQEYWSGLPFPSAWDLPDSGIEPGSPALQADSLLTELLGKPRWRAYLTLFIFFFFSYLTLKPSLFAFPSICGCFPALQFICLYSLSFQKAFEEHETIVTAAKPHALPPSCLSLRGWEGCHGLEVTVRETSSYHHHLSP